MLDGSNTLGGKDTIKVEQVAMRYCTGSSYCFKLSTTDINVMINTFGPKLGDDEWDEVSRGGDCILASAIVCWDIIC